MARRKQQDDGVTKPLVDAIDDALSAVLDLVRTLKKTAKKSGGDAGKASDRIRRAAENARKGASTRIHKAWDVLVHGTDEEADGAAPKKRRSKTRR